MLVLHTNHGPIKIALDFDKAPKTAKNFMRYAKEGFFDGTLFHRVIGNFMIQGGGFTAGMEHKNAHDPIENEADNELSNKRGTLAMARTSDPHSASSQFFINVVDNPFLDFQRKTVDGWGYCVFGEVIEGMETVDAIKGVETTSRHGHQDVPAKDVIIERVELVE